jgi:hypothetical protein
VRANDRMASRLAALERLGGTDKRDDADTVLVLM